MQTKWCKLWTVFKIVFYSKERFLVKKVLSLVAVCLLLVGMMSVGFAASAATPKEEIIAAVKAAMPAEYQAKYLPMVENALAQVEVTAEQAQEVIANIDTVKETVKEDKGDSLSEYAAEEAKVVLTEFGAACETLGLTYEIVEAENPDHEGDIAIKVYKADAAEKTPVGSIDGDGVKKTNAPAVSVAAISALALALGAAFVSKKVAAR